MAGQGIAIGVISVRGPDYHPTRRLAEAASSRGCTLVCLDPYRVWPGYRGGRAVVWGQSRSVMVDAVLPRQGAEIRDGCLPLLRHLEQMDVVVVNRLEAILLARNKFSTLQVLAAAGLPVADTIFVNHRAGVREAVHLLGGRAVAKPVSGRQGSRIQLIDSGSDLENGLQKEIDAGRGILLQEYLPPEQRTDLRVLVVGSRVVAAMALAPVDGEFRANFGLGGRPRAVDLDAQQSNTAVAAAKALGLEVAGVDLMVCRPSRLVVGEVNYAPGFRGLEGVCSRDVAGAIIEYVLERHQQRYGK